MIMVANPATGQIWVTNLIVKSVCVYFFYFSFPFLFFFVYCNIIACCVVFFNMYIPWSHWADMMQVQVPGDLQAGEQFLVQIWTAAAGSHPGTPLLNAHFKWHLSQCPLLYPTAQTQTWHTPERPNYIVQAHQNEINQIRTHVQGKVQHKKTCALESKPKKASCEI